MKRTFQYLLCLLTALQLSGGHLGVLQAVAWARMLHDYTRDRGLVEGVKDTFDGDHPCAMCCRVAKARREQEKQQPALPSNRELDKVCKVLGLLPSAEVPPPRWTLTSSEVSFADPPHPAPQWCNSVPVPPPRVLA